MTSLHYLPVASAEFISASIWYDQRSPGLGWKFQADVQAALIKIQQDPKLFPVIQGTIRRINLRRFPYALYYQIEPNRIVILSCFHTSRHPKVWQDRTS